MSSNEFGLLEGVVVESFDDGQDGRVKVWVPSLDGNSYNVENLPYVIYLTPFGGQASNLVVGSEEMAQSGLKSYGFWAPPPLGALVIIGLLHNDPNLRVYMGSFFRDHGNRSLPAGRMKQGEYPFTDTMEPIAPSAKHLKEQFKGMLNTSEAMTRGAYERQIGDDAISKDGTNGYTKDLAHPEKTGGAIRLINSGFCFVTPAGHAIVMNDAAENARTRIKTINGHQIILDDANERIYISTCDGKSWLEFDQDGRIHMYAEGGFSMSSGDDINFSASGDINFAGTNVNIVGSGTVAITGCGSLELNGIGGLNLESGSVLNVLAASKMTLSGSTIDLNGPTAGSAKTAGVPSIVPTHEPWKREASSGTRNKYWKD